MEEGIAVPHLRRILVARRDAIAEQWYQAISQTSFIPLSAPHVRARLSELVIEAIDVLLAMPLDGRRARGIGEALAQMHYVRAEAVGGTLRVLGRELVVGLSADQVAALHPQLVGLLDELSSGYFRACLDVVLQEQEGIRNALVTALRAAEQQLRRARDELEIRVEERTQELAQANKELRAEIAERTRVEQALRQSEEKYRDLVENISDIIYTVDREGLITYISPAAKRLLGYDSVDVIGQHARQFIHSDDVPRLLAMLQDVLAGATLQSEYRVISRSGDIRWMRTSSRPIVIDGKAVGVRGVLADITERKRIEQELQESEARYRAVVQDQTDLICRFRPDGTFIFFNEAYNAFFGREKARSGDDSFLHWVSAQEQSNLEAHIRAITPDVPVRTVERLSIRVDGEGRWLQWTLRGMFDDQSRLTEVQAVGRDITERRRAEEALRESEERWRLLVENAPDTVVAVDRRGDILFVNRMPAGSATKPEQLVGTNVLGYVASGFRQGMEQAIEDVFERGLQSTHEVAAHGPDGDMVWQAIRYGPIWRNGRVTAAMLILRDISERKKLEEMKDNLIRDVSHELRTPLAKVQMSLELLQELVEAEDTDRERAIRTSEIATRNVRRLLETVEGILDLSRLESGTLAYRREPVSVDELVEEAIAYMRPLAQAKGLRLLLRRVGAGGALWVEGDREKLFRVLINLVDNAIKFTDEGQVLVSVEHNHGEVMVAVSDSGIGISSDNLSHIFERFFQARTTARGVGIGLTICRTIVEGHGGRIWATSPGEGQGSTFCISLPAENGP